MCTHTHTHTHTHTPYKTQYIHKLKDIDRQIPGARVGKNRLTKSRVFEASCGRPALVLHLVIY